MLFAALVVMGLAVFRDYGISWDEPGVHAFGEATVNYVLHGDQSWRTRNFSGTSVTGGSDVLAYYPPVVSTSQALIDRLAGSSRTGYQVGHLFDFTLFLAGVAAMYGLCRRQFRGWGWGVLGAAIFVASPRIFSHAFVNPKDAPPMALLVVAFYCFVRFFEADRWPWLAATGVVSALAIDVRPNAVIIIVLVAGVMLADALFSEDRRAALEHAALRLGLYGGVTAGVVYMLWPLLWSSPIGNLLLAFRTMAHFPWPGVGTLFRGHIVPATAVPWYYAPWWIAITTPIPYLVFAAIGLVTLRPHRIFALFRARHVDRLLFVYAAWLLVPLVYLGASHAVLYDEWRQVLFVYPPLVVLAVAGAARLYRLFTQPVRRRLLVAGLVVSIGWVAGRMVELHPYEAVYFNALVGGARGAEGRYELDYWGLSYYEGLRYVLDSTSGRSKVAVCSQPGWENVAMLNPREQARIEIVDGPEADFGICAPRVGMRPLPAGSKVFSVRRDGVELLYVTQVR